MCNSCFMIFANELLLAVYFICILDYGNDVRQKQIQAIFLLEFKWVINHQRKFTNINKIFGPETVNRHTVQWWFKKFCKGDENLEDEEHSGRQLEADNDKLRGIIKADSLTTTQELVEELNIDHSMVI